MVFSSNNLHLSKQELSYENKNKSGLCSVFVLHRHCSRPRSSLPTSHCLTGAERGQWRLSSQSQTDFLLGKTEQFGPTWQIESQPDTLPVSVFYYIQNYIILQIKELGFYSVTKEGRDKFNSPCENS